MQIIPWRNLPSWQQEINFEDTIYHLAFHWNSLNEFWSMDILTKDETPIILGIKLVVDYGVTAHYSNEKLFKGEILVIDFSDDVDEISRIDMGSRVQLIYRESKNVI